MDRPLEKNPVRASDESMRAAVGRSVHIARHPVLDCVCVRRWSRPKWRPGVRFATPVRYASDTPECPQSMRLEWARSLSASDSGRFFIVQVGNRRFCRLRGTYLPDNGDREIASDDEADAAFWFSHFQAKNLVTSANALSGQLYWLPPQSRRATHMQAILKRKFP